MRTAAIAAPTAKPKIVRAHPTPRRTGVQRCKIEPAPRASIFVVPGRRIGTIGINSHHNGTRDAGITAR
jgi:hypothetical protein